MLARLKNHLLFFLILITTGAYGWYYLNTFVPNDDSLQVFQNFYYFYSEFFITGNLAQWAPYDSFGTPSTWWQLTALTPISYFAMLIGKVCYVTDTLLLFKFSLLGELLVLLLGAFLLAKKLFQHQTTVAIISLSASLTCYFYSQIFFHLHIYYMLPLLLYYLFTWIDTNKPYLCWLCGILFIFWLLGSPQYFCFLYIPLLLIISLIYSSNKLPLKNLFNPSLRNYLFILVFISLSITYLMQLTSFNDYTIIVRRLDGLSNPLTTFLNFGDFANNFNHLFSLIFVGNNLAAYIDLLIAASIIWSILFVRNKPFIAFLIAGVFLAWFSFSGLFTTACYFFPGLSLYRHVGFVNSLLKLFIILCAGYGLDWFFNQSTKKKITALFIAIAIYIFFLDGLGLSHQWLLSLDFKNAIKSIKPGEFIIVDRLLIYLTALLVLICLYVINKIYPALTPDTLNKSIKILFMCIFFLDIFSFQYKSYTKQLPNKISHEKQYIFTPLPLVYQPIRTDTPIYLRQTDVINAFKTHEGNLSPTMYNMAQFDPCTQYLPLTFKPRAIEQLLKASKEQAIDINQLISCQSEKLYLINASNLSLEQLNNIQHIKLKEPSNTITVKHFSANKISMDVDAPISGAWLIYSDPNHPGWHAKINSKETAIESALIAYKAVFVKGQSRVDFYYFNGWVSIGSYILMISGILFSIFIILLLITSSGFPLPFKLMDFFNNKF